MKNSSLEDKAARLAGRVAEIRREVEILTQEGEEFPAVWRNARRIEACLRMLEINLGQAGGPPPGPRPEG